jgi:RHS repeat-associated protein
MGRLTWTKPPTGHGSWVEHAYTRATSSSALANVHTRYRANGSKTGTIVAEEKVWFDALGKVWKEEKLLPSSTWTTRETLYDGMGHKKSVSEWGNTGKKTQFLNYDAFGRPTRIRPPDGSTHDVTLAYTGDRVITRNVKVGTTWTGTAVAETTFSTTERYDRQGRLYQLLEASGVNNATTTTTYGYDVGNRLKSVSMPSQSRTFNYDTRGFLTSEVHPETGTITYGNYDARGHAGTRSTGAASLAYTYDRAERLIQVQETAPVNRTLKSWTYSTANSSSNYRNGKVLYATRNNYVAIGATPFKVSFQETFTYAGRDGRVSQRVLTQATNDGAVSESFTQSWTYDVLGNVISLGYPDCTLAPCTSSPRTVSSTYTKGFLTGVTGFASSLTYHPNQQVNQVTNANGVVTTYAMDPNHMARPASIATTAGWSTGAYAYDGAGNVTRIRQRTLPLRRRLPTPPGRHRHHPRRLHHHPHPDRRLRPLRQHPVDHHQRRGGEHPHQHRQPPQLPCWLRRRGQPPLLERRQLPVRRPRPPLALHLRSRGLALHVHRRRRARLGLPHRRLGQLLGHPRPRRQGAARVPTHAGWTVDRDYVYRGDKLLAAVTPQGTRHFHLDHLGSVRQVTGATAAQVAFHAFYPFGKEATSLGQADQEQMQFTGHERDLQNTTTGDADDLDYMHARYYNMHVGRFTSVDPARSWDPKAPQSWNRYSYALGNPHKNVDPDGQIVETLWDIANIGIGVTSLVKNVRDGSWGAAAVDLGGVLLDTAAATLPIVPGGAGAALKAARAVEKIDDLGDSATLAARGGTAAARQIGRAGEAAVRAVEDIGPSRAITIGGRTRIPDGLTSTTLSEVKNVQSLSYTSQLRSYAAFAQQQGLAFNLYVRQDTRLSGPLLEAVSSGAINLKFIPR